MNDVVKSLQRVRVRGLLLEAQIHDAIAVELNADGFSYMREAALPGGRADFLVMFDDGNVIIEVKKGKPNSQRLERQITRYAESTPLVGMIVVIERNVFSLPAEVAGVPVRYVSLSTNWGIAL